MYVFHRDRHLQKYAFKNIHFTNLEITFNFKASLQHISDGINLKRKEKNRKEFFTYDVKPNDKTLSLFAT